MNFIFIIFLRHFHLNIIILRDFHYFSDLGGKTQTKHMNKRCYYWVQFILNEFLTKCEFVWTDQTEIETLVGAVKKSMLTSCRLAFLSSHFERSPHLIHP